MPKSFKICPVRHFNEAVFQKERTLLNQQPPLNGLKDEVPHTTIRSSHVNPGFEDFHQYIIEHDRIVKMPGRYGNIKFPEFTYTGTIAGFHSSQHSMLLLSGKKNDVLSFCGE